MIPNNKSNLNKKLYLTISLGLMNELVEEKINYLINSFLAFSFKSIYIKLPYFKPKEKVIDDNLKEILSNYFKDNAALSISVIGEEENILFLEEDISSAIPEAVVTVERSE